MRKRKMIANFIVLILFTIIMSFSINVKVNAAENTIVSIEDSMNINDYRRMKANTLTRKFNSDRSLFNTSFSKEQIMYEIKLGLENLQERINLDDYIQYFRNYNDYEIPMNYFFETLNEYPEIFYPNLKVTCSFSYRESTKEIVSYSLVVTYQYDNNTINNMKNTFNKRISDIKNQYLSNVEDDLEKEYIIHDYIVQNCKYDHGYDYNMDNLPTIDHTAYGSLVNGIAVCDGYSKGAKVLFDLCNIESGIVDSDPMKHAWNYVNIYGRYYNLDITWDDLDIGNYIDYSYFNISNYDMSTGENPHTWNSSAYPSCTSNDFNFLRDGKIYIRDEAQLYTIIKVDGVDEFYIRDLDGSNEWIKFQEDIDNDGIIDISDMAIMANNYNKTSRQADFDYRCDLNNDGIIDIYDLVRVSRKIKS